MWSIVNLLGAEPEGRDGERRARARGRTAKEDADHLAFQHTAKTSIGVCHGNALIDKVRKIARAEIADGEYVFHVLPLEVCQISVHPRASAATTVMRGLLARR